MCLSKVTPNTELRRRLMRLHIFKAQPIYWAGSQGNGWRGGSGRICLALGNGCLSWQQALRRLGACSDGKISPGTFQTSVFSLGWEGLFTECIPGTRQKPRAPHLPFWCQPMSPCFLRDSNQGTRDVKRKENTAQNLLGPARE